MMTTTMMMICIYVHVSVYLRENIITTHDNFRNSWLIFIHYNVSRCLKVICCEVGSGAHTSASTRASMSPFCGVIRRLMSAPPPPLSHAL